MPKTRREDIVVIIPGIAGSVLHKDGKDIWAISKEVGLQALINRDNWVEQLKLNGSDDCKLDDLGDGIKATKLIEDAYLILGLEKIDGYTKLSNIYIRQLLECNYRTIAKGIEELNDSSVMSSPKIRRSKGGRKQALATLEGINEGFLKVIG